MAQILVIDDDPQVRSVLERYLQRAGHLVQSAPDGRTGARIVRERAPDIVITDLLMPEEDGLEFIRGLRRTHPSLPVIAISGGMAAMPMDFLPVAAKLGATLTLQKPIPLAKLLDAVNQLLNPGQTAT